MIDPDDDDYLTDLFYEGMIEAERDTHCEAQYDDEWELE